MTELGITGQDTPTEAEMLHHLMRERYSCRGYRPDPVPDAVIAAIMDTARLTASWCNTQPWQMVVTRPGTTEPFAAALMQKVRETDGVDPDIPFPTAYRGAFQERRRETGFALYNAVGIARDDKAGRARQGAENFRFFGAPHVAILTTEADLGPYGAIDCGGFLTAFLLAATAQGVATIAQAALARQAGFIRDYFGIAEERQVVCGVAFGYADPDHPANGFRTRREAAEAIYRFA